MTQKRFHILLLARPSYLRNGIEATLLTIDALVVETVTTHKEASQSLAIGIPDLFLIVPNGLDLQAACELCSTYFGNRLGQVAFLIEPYTDRKILGQCGNWQLFEIETSNELREMTLQKLSASSSLSTQQDCTL